MRCGEYFSAHPAYVDMSTKVLMTKYALSHNFDYAKVTKVREGIVTDWLISTF